MFARKLAPFFLFALFVFVRPSHAQEPAQSPSANYDTTYTLPDIGAFMQIGSARPAGYSWDGREAYFVSSMSGTPQIYRIGKSGWPYQLTFLEDGIGLFTWGYPFFSLDYGGNKAIAGSSPGGSELFQLYLVDTRTGFTRRLTHNPEARYSSVLWAKDDKSIFYSSTEENGIDNNVYVMDIATGNSRKIFGDTAAFAGAKYPVVLSQDGTALLIERWNSNFDMDLFLLDLITGD